MLQYTGIRLTDDGQIGRESLHKRQNSSDTAAKNFILFRVMTALNIQWLTRSRQQLVLWDSNK